MHPAEILIVMLIALKAKQRNRNVRHLHPSWLRSEVFFRRIVPVLIVPPRQRTAQLKVSNKMLKMRTKAIIPGSPISSRKRFFPLNNNYSNQIVDFIPSAKTEKKSCACVDITNQQDFVMTRALVMMDKNIYLASSLIIRCEMRIHHTFTCLLFLQMSMFQVTSFSLSGTLLLVCSSRLQ